ncbi:hypothetical protein CXG81DRAFT_18332 [Caulochytrium protostelioides]|uniref:Uncharacterized protein n=1 Tax=Caulochytrium protostelioides TaxID=1555241 RepID=A0A4P9WV63_9FUNG|nr:hypothetical protein CAUPRSCDRAFT_11118 [Caulochytrium protostelioides]RKP01976.1 hypothetical protein CXG81DRAFT_18332 [Caulochytrium protostelioides]|eukprot:RKP01976.1 hypothetical protein CXG81DRAFT_18332 [Caulochytrium protostelioides]
MASPTNFRGLAVIRNTGQVLFYKSFKPEESLDTTLLASVVVSVTSAFRSLQTNDAVQEIALHRTKFVFRQVETYIFVAITDPALASSLVSGLLTSATALCTLLCGPPADWAADHVVFNGFQDILTPLFTHLETDLTRLTLGVKHAFMDASARERVSRLLSHIEARDHVLNKATMLLVGHTVLASRFTLAETRTLTTLYAARPLVASPSRHTATAVSIVPVYLRDSWAQLVGCRLHGEYTLLVAAHMDASIDLLHPVLEACWQQLVSGRLELPLEETPLPLRLFAKRETLGLIYHNLRTGAALCPVLRPASALQHAAIRAALAAHFTAASARFERQPGLSRICDVSEGGLYNYAVAEGPHRLFLVVSLEGSDGGLTADSVRDHGRPGPGGRGVGAFAGLDAMGGEMSGGARGLADPVMGSGGSLDAVSAIADDVLRNIKAII